MMPTRGSENSRVLAPDTASSDLRQQLELAAQVQKSLLPARRCCFPGWEVGFEYEAAGFVSGDYVDLIPAKNGGVHFVLGDVSGKGIAASMLMSHLHASLRALLEQELPLEEVLRKTSRIFCEISLPAQFATLVLGTATPDGSVEFCNAGHVPVLLVSQDDVKKLSSSALPVGMFCNQTFTSERIKAKSGDILFLYSDGLSEAENPDGEEYGEERIGRLLYGARAEELPALLSTVLRDVRTFSGGKLADDRSFLVLRRS